MRGGGGIKHENLLSKYRSLIPISYKFYVLLCFIVYLGRMGVVNNLTSQQ